MSVTVLTMMGRSQELPRADAVAWLKETVKAVPMANREYAIRSRIIDADDIEGVIEEVMA